MNPLASIREPTGERVSHARSAAIDLILLYQSQSARVRDHSAEPGKCTDARPGPQTALERFATLASLSTAGCARIVSVWTPAAAE